MTKQRPARDLDDGETGSFLSSEPVFLVVGRLGKPHGLKGDLIFHIYTDFPERLKKNMVILVGEDYVPMELIRIKEHSGKLLVGFEGINNREQAGEISKQWVYVRTAEVPSLPDGDYYHHELIGLSMVTDTGDFLGTITEILETGANDVFIVSGEERKDILVPFIDEVVVNIDQANKMVEVHLLPGLLADI